MKRTWAFGIIGIVLTLMLVGYNVQLQKKIILKEAEASMNNLLNSVEMDLDRSFFGLGQVFLGLGNYLEAYSNIGAADAPAVRRVINDLLQENPYLTALVVLGSDGQVLHWNNNFQKPDLSQRDYFRIHKNQHLKGLYIGLPQESIMNKGQWIFGISRAFRDSDGNLTKVLAAIVDVKYFYRQYQKLFAGTDTQLTISSLQGHIYTQIPGHNRSTGQIDPDIKARLRSHTEAEVHNHPNSKGEMHLGAIRKISEYPLLVSVTKLEKTVLSAWQKSTWSFTLLGIVVSLALLFLTRRTALYQRRQIEIQSELQLQAITDPLTRLANRRYVLEQSQLEIKKAQRANSPLSMIMLDLDHFKQVNDNYGHQDGDKVLETVAGLLKQTCRETDIVSRFGGEEFLLILPGTDLEGAINNANKIREALEKYAYQSQQGEYHVTASLGVTQWGEDETKTSGALRRADSALYEAKKAGRNTVKWIPSNLRSDSQKNTDFWLHQRLK